MKIATWNVNSIRARLERLLPWLDRAKPDVLCLQELKCTDDAFPYDAVREAGYEAAVLGQKTYNGVAILCKEKPEDVRRGMSDNPAEEQARLISARVRDIRVMSAYFPNGGSVGSEKWEYKLSWMRRLKDALSGDADMSERLVLCGDFNVAVDDADVARPDEWAGSVLCHEDVRAALRDIRELGLVDVFREHNPEGGIYSWWDYRALAFPKHNGLRIDHIYGTPGAASVSESAWVERDERKGKKPSDHAPVVASFAF